MACLSLTDLVRAAVLAELEQQRPMLDAATVSSVSIIVQVATSGRPVNVAFRTEGRRSLVPERLR